MKLLDFIKKIGHNIVTYNIHWNLENHEVMISTDVIDVIIDLFPDYYLRDEDSVYMYVKNDIIVIDLYIYKPDQE